MCVKAFAPPAWPAGRAGAGIEHYLTSAEPRWLRSARGGGCCLLATPRLSHTSAAAADAAQDQPPPAAPLCQGVLGLCWVLMGSPIGCGFPAVAQLPTTP